MSLAVKYRPQTFDGVIGQHTVIKSLQAALKRPVQPHSWLFVGAAGTGKTTTARLLAQHFAEGQLGPNNLIEINAASNTGVDDMRSVIAQTCYKAIGSSPVKTILIDEVHRLSGNAWDSLLKPIEEPMAHVFWVLASTNPTKIPDTIKTRCVTYVFKPVDEVCIYELLEGIANKEAITCGPEILELVAENSNGSPRQALTNLELCAGCKTTNEARSLLQSALHLKGPVDLAKLIINRRKPSWQDVTRLVASIDADPESTRIVISNYIAGALMKAKSDGEALYLLSILEAFSTPYVTSDKLAPLLLSIGLALGINNGG